MFRDVFFSLIVFIFYMLGCLKKGRRYLKWIKSLGIFNESLLIIGIMLLY